MKLALDISYDGSDFYGLQKQKDKRTVVGEVEKALKKIGILKTHIITSGRTDRGVHANSQVIDFEVPYFWSDITKFQLSLQKHLPDDIDIKKVFKVQSDFHSRYSAKSRVYRYISLDKKPAPFFHNYIGYLPNLNLEQAKENIKLFEGVHDFSYFAKDENIKKSTKREIKKAFVYRYKNFTIFYFEANGFLRSQVRMMVEALCTLNSKQIVEQLNMIKIHSNKLAPPQGLYLSKIKY